MVKRNAWSVFILIAILLCPVFAFAQPELPEPTREFYVADYARVLSQDVKNIIISVNKNYEKTEESPQLVVATVPNMQGMDIVDYSVRLFEKWEIGKKKYDNGILLLLSTEERRVRIEVGYGLEGAITDSKAGDILDNVLPQLSEENYSEGLLNAFYQIVQEVNSEYGYDDSTIMQNFQEYNFTPSTNRNTRTPLFTVRRIIIAIGVIFLIWFDSRFLGGFIFRTILWMLFFGRGGGRGGGGGYGGGSFGGGGSSGGGGADRGF
ncbi:TPM domain-containing protein [Wukongibacter baidiensis]|uniref:TPM domain-containing protein n=1 Tax=Wukongibacter baidiensis TaxID=1723361 RepID=UPI003D7FB693